jgi:uncharacterized protein YyaL (SSP411 family)
LLQCSTLLERSDLKEVALACADYLLAARTQEGAVGHWKQDQPNQAPPVVFDTGQVILGWLAAWQQTDQPRYLQAAVDAADWLVRVQSASGAWVQYQHLGTVKVIDTRVAWALLKLDQATSQPSYTLAARRNLDWALSQQQPNGWFRHAAFRPEEDPFTHTIAYTAEGLLKSGVILAEPRYISAAQRVAGALLERQRKDGSLASTYTDAWQPSSRSSCLTGNCQMASLWLLFHDLSGEIQYLDAAHRAIAFVASTQRLNSSHEGIRGGIAGSYPIYGRYERFKYPNWAAKFFVDALLAVETAEENHRQEDLPATESDRVHDRAQARHG